MLKISLKFLFAFALLYWLISSGRLDFSLVKKSFIHGHQWLFAFLLLTAQSALATFRYKSLLQTKSQKTVPFWSLLKINYIGLFFSSALPGAVTGDFIKLFYVKKLDSSFSKTFLITTTFLDRLLGLFALLFLSGTFSLLYFSEVITLSDKISHIILINLLLFFCALFIFVLLVSPSRFQDFVLNLIKKIPFFEKKLFFFFQTFFSFREKKMVLAFSFLLSFIIQFLNIIAFWIISSPFFEHPLPFPYIFTFIPVGLVATAIPVSPGGLGVGHVLFSNLFMLVNIKNGASLFNLYFLCNLSHNLLGAISYLFSGASSVRTPASTK